jgi:hypothetical protein
MLSFHIIVVAMFRIKFTYVCEKGVNEFGPVQPSITFQLTIYNLVNGTQYSS